jgi:hypothetical protein
VKFNTRETKGIFVDDVGTDHYTCVLGVVVKVCETGYIVRLIEADMYRTFTEEPCLAFLCGDCQWLLYRYVSGAYQKFVSR